MSNFPQQIDSLFEDPFVQRIADFFHKQSICPAGAEDQNLLVAFSGGPDSTALLAALVCLRQKHSRAVGALTISALHVNHALRGAESQLDEDFCRALCAHWQVPFYCERLSGATHDEAGLRAERYLALANLAAAIAAPYVLSGHTLDDQCETLLFRLLRGTGPAGLTGMAASRPLADRICLARPLLQCSRDDVVQFLRRAGVKSRFDSSNDDQRYTRNFLRRQVLPLIAERFPGYADRFERLRRLISEDEEIILAAVEESRLRVIYSEQPPERWSWHNFLAEPVGLQRRLVAAALEIRNIPLSFEKTEQMLQMLQAGAGVITLNAGWRLQVADGLISWLETGSDSAAYPDAALLAAAAQKLRIPGLTIALELSCAVNITELAPNEDWQFPPRQADEVLVDLTTISGPLVLRPRRPGDHIRPLGMTESVRLKKFLHTHKPKAEASSALSTARPQSLGLVIADEQEVLWVPGYGLSDKIKVGGRPTHRLRFSALAADRFELV